jgi:ubiquinol-cytochrome c reductase iron-sulfur subunit
MATPVACSTISPFLRTCLRRPHRLSAAAAATAASLTRSPVTAAAASVPAALAQRRAKSDSALGDSALTAWVETPFNETANQPTTKVPDFGKYKSSRNPESNVLFQYFMAGTFGMLTAAGAKSTVQGKYFFCIFLHIFFAI